MPHLLLYFLLYLPTSPKRASSSAPLPVRPHHFLSHAAYSFFASLPGRLDAPRQHHTFSRTKTGRDSEPLVQYFSNVAPLRIHYWAKHLPPLVSTCLLPRQASGFPEDSCIAHVNASILLLRHWSTPHSLSRTCPLVFKSLIGTSTAHEPPSQRLHDRSTCPPVVHCPRSPPTLLLIPHRARSFRAVSQTQATAHYSTLPVLAGPTFGSSGKDVRCAT